MPQTTTAYSRLQVLTPDQNYDTQIDGGNALYAALNTLFSKLGDNIVGRWSNDIFLASGGTTTYTHNFGQALTQLKVLIFVSNALLPKATQDAQFTISQSSTNAISIANISGSDKTFQVYVLAFPLSVRTADLDPSIDAVISRLEFTAGTLLDEMSTPTTPSSGKVALYAKSDKKLYTKNSLGTETQVGAGAGGSGKNYLSTYSDFSLDPSTGMVNNLTATGNRASNTTVWGANTTSLLSQTSSALRDTTSGQLVNGSSASNFIETPLFTLDPIDANTGQLYISFDSYSSGSGVASGDWLIQVIRYNSSGVFQENITPSITNLPSGYYQFKCAFNHSATATDQYAIRFRSNTATARTLIIDTLVVGPQSVIDAAAIGGWIAYTPTFSNFGTVSNTAAYYRRVGDTMEIQAFFTSGTTVGALASMTLPSGFTIDSSKIPVSATTAASGAVVGFVVSNESGNSVFQPGTVLANTATSTSLFYFGPGTATASHLVPKNGNAAFTANSQDISINIKVPISQWTSVVTLAGNPNIEYAFNTSTSDAADTSSFGNGATGTAGIFNATALTAQRLKRVQFQTPIQPTDRVQIEISPQAGIWIPIQNAVVVSSSIPYTLMPTGNDCLNTPSTTTSSGMSYIPVSGSSTQLDINFGRFAVNSGLTGATTLGWNDASFSGYKWRVAKYSGVGPAELAPATYLSAGSVSRESQWTAYTPTYSAGFGTVSNNVAFYKVLGDTLYIIGSCSPGTTAASIGSISIPSQFTIATTKLPLNLATGNAGNIIGSWGATGVTGGQFMLTATGTSSSSVYIGGLASGTNPILQANGNVMGTPAVFSFKCEVPII